MQAVFDLFVAVMLGCGAVVTVCAAAAIVLFVATGVVAMIREITHAPPARRDTSPTAYWVRITGRMRRRGDASPPLSHYSGVLLQETAVGGAPTEFYADDLPLVEIAGNENVPDGAVVLAHPTDAGGRYVFQYSAALP